MDPKEFERLNRNSVQRIVDELKKKEQFHESPQISRALIIEEEIYKRSNECGGFSETHNIWEDAKCLELYRTFTDELVLNMGNEVGPYWRRVESGKIAPKHIFNKFCKTAATMPVPPRVKKRALDHLEQVEKSAKKKKQKKEKKHKKEKKKKKDKKHVD